MTKSRNLRLVKEPKASSETGLGPDAHAWYMAMKTEYAIEDRGGESILMLAAQAYERAAAAKALLEEQGMVAVDKWGQLKPHPAAAIERDARTSMLQCLKALHLDVEPIRDRVGRPDGSRR